MGIKKAISGAVAVSVLIYTAIVCGDCAVITYLDHDEHQFMAGAYMVARHGLHPFRDFAYFHMPNLVYAYAPLFFTPRPFLAARLFNGVCAFAICLMVFFFARSLFRSVGARGATFVASASTVLMANNILFRFEACRVWNHTSALLCAVIAFLLLNKALADRRPAFFALSGFALGMAIGIRLTFAPLMAAFALVILLARPISWRNRALALFVFLVGTVMANLPAIYFALTNWDDFAFGTFRYPKLSTRYYIEQLHDRPHQTWIGKLYHLTEIFIFQWPNLLIPMIACIGLVLLGIGMTKRSFTLRFEVIFLGTLLAFLLVGCFAPTPSQAQYFVVVVPFLLLLGLSAMASLDSVRLQRSGMAAIVVAAAVSFFGQTELNQRMTELSGLFHPSTWVPLRIANGSAWLKRQLGSRKEGKVLTISPIWAIESDVPIYKEFVTGAFGWRVSYLLSADEAAARKLPWSPGIEQWLQKSPPAAVLTYEQTIEFEEAALVRAISQAGYSPVETRYHLLLWERPQ